MLFINKQYNELSQLKVINESSVASDSFEKSCIRFLKKNYPDHNFILKGGDNKTVLDILVDDSFYIECKMTESTVSPKKGAQVTGFGIKPSEDNKSFILSNTVTSNEYANIILKYINDNFDEFIKVSKPHTKTCDINLDQKLFATYIYNYYNNKGAKFFIINYNKKFVLFKNTISNLLKYFDISACARYYSNGTKSLPTKYIDPVLSVLKNKYNITNVVLNNDSVYIKSEDLIETPYIDCDTCQIYLSDYKQEPGTYRVMKCQNIGSTRVLFTIKAKLAQDQKDIDTFEKYLNNHK
jgi:hypothetical protein